MKKIIIIGDIHGRNTWKIIVEKHLDADLIIFVGDYFDSFDISGIIQLHNFNDILKFKQDNPDKVILLCGNHDYHYLSGIAPGTTYMGHQMGMQWDFAHVLNPLVRNGILEVAYEFSEYLVTHAGLTKTWCKNVGIDMSNLVEDINLKFMYQLKDFAKCSNDMYGNSINEGPFWVRPQALMLDKLDNYQQIVGHIYGFYRNKKWCN